jgi:hypothetical protein
MRKDEERTRAKANIDRNMRAPPEGLKGSVTKASSGGAVEREI